MWAGVFIVQQTLMSNYPVPAIEHLIAEYIVNKENTFHFGRKKLDAEKEYNRLLTKYNGESKNYSLDQANKIYTSYLEMLAYTEQSKAAEEKFMEAEEKLRQVGQILFEASISAEIAIPANSVEGPRTREVTVTYANGQVIVH